MPKRVDEFGKSVVLQGYGKCVGKPAIPYLKNFVIIVPLARFLGVQLVLRIASFLILLPRKLPNILLRWNI